MSVYAGFVATTSEVKAEFEMWQQRWQQTPVHDRPATAIFTMSDDVHKNRTHLWNVRKQTQKQSNE